MNPDQEYDAIVKNLLENINSDEEETLDDILQNWNLIEEAKKNLQHASDSAKYLSDFSEKLSNMNEKDFETFLKQLQLEEQVLQERLKKTQHARPAKKQKTQATKQSKAHMQKKEAEEERERNQQKYDEQKQHGRKQKLQYDIQHGIPRR